MNLSTHAFDSTLAVEFWDQFQSGAGLVIVSLHSKSVAGIDYKNNIDGKICANHLRLSVPMLIKNSPVCSRYSSSIEN